MINKIGHYAIENNPTIYDEEAMTALELCGRVTAKVNEVISQFNNLSGRVEKAVESMTTSIDATAERIMSQLLADGKIFVTMSYVTDTQALNLIATNGEAPGSGAVYYAQQEYLDIL